MNDYINKTVEELVELKKEKKSEFEKLTQDVLKGKEKNIMKLKMMRKDIARISTAINFVAKEVKKEEQDA